MGSRKSGPNYDSVRPEAMLQMSIQLKSMDVVRMEGQAVHVKGCSLYVKHDLNHHTNCKAKVHVFIPAYKNTCMNFLS
jgi:hypothetical protein